MYIKKIRESLDIVSKDVKEQRAFVATIIDDIIDIVSQFVDLDPGKQSALRSDLVQWYKRNIDKIYTAARQDYFG